MIKALIGFYVGGIFGFFICALFVASKDKKK